MPDEHAPFSPSASDRWLVCPASVRLTQEANYPNQDTYHTVRGTLIHSKGEQHLLKGSCPDDVAKDTDTLVASFMRPDGLQETVEVTPDEWIPYVQTYVGFVRDLIDEHRLLGYTCLLQVEQRVNIAGGKNGCWGTADAQLIISEETGRVVCIYVIDLKAGTGHMVGADAPQFRTYLVGAALKHVDKEHLDDCDFIAAVVQPADVNSACKQHSYTWAELKKHRTKINKAIKLAKTAEPGPTGDHCLWCPVGRAGDCPAQRAEAVAILDDGDLIDADKQLAKVGEPPTAPAISRFAEVLEAAPRIRQILDAVEARALDLALKDQMPGFKAVEGRSQRKWDPDVDEEVLADEISKLGVEPYEQKLCSFTKVEKAAGKGAVDHLLIKPPGKPTLVPATDKRPALLTVESLGDIDPEEL